MIVYGRTNSAMPNTSGFFVVFVFQNRRIKRKGIRKKIFSAAY